MKQTRCTGLGWSPQIHGIPWNRPRPSRTQLITQTYNGIAFAFRDDGWFNMTHAAKCFGKDVHEFTRLPSTGEYVDALTKTGKFPELKVAKAGRNGGTWAHPKLAVFFARWLDVRFAVWCDAVIEDILTKKAEVVITKPAESAVMALPDL
jgi:hypothetical protein